MNQQEFFKAYAEGTLKGGARLGNVYVNADSTVIYSYGGHFPLAFKYDNRVYVNTDKYSVTTSKQQTYLKQALTVAGYLLQGRDTATIKQYIQDYK